jgi:uncharacterized protein involved in tellurium resistance
MPSVLPLMPSYGTGGETGLTDENLEVFANLNYRRYSPGTAIARTFNLEFEELSKSEFDTFDAFFTARKQAVGSDFEFYFYDPNEVDSVDPTGNSSTGRHLAIFTQPKYQWVRSGPCTFDVTVEVLRLN